MKLEYNLINGKDGLDESLYLFVGPKISELGDTIEGDSDNETSLYKGYGNLNIPNNIIEIGESAFAGCIGFSGLLTIPNSVIEISNYAFSSCSGFTGPLSIPNSVTAIGDGAFWGCSGFTSLTIPESVTSIGERAFGSFLSLTNITCLASTPPTLGSNAFLGTTCPIYVPATSVDVYKAASGWSTYASRIQPITT